MPGSTPNFAIPYPCSGDTIDCTIFQSFTQAIQTAITTVKALESTALHRPTASASRSAAQSIAVGVATNMQFDTENYDTNGMIDLAVNNDRITIQTTGMYMLTAFFQPSTPATTVTSNSVAISSNGTIVYRKKNSSDTNIFMSMSLTGLLFCNAGDIIRLVGLWTGTGGPANMTGTLSALLVTLP